MCHTCLCLLSPRPPAFLLTCLSVPVYRYSSLLELQNVRFNAFALTGRDCSNTWNPGCRFACPGLCAPLAFQAALANALTEYLSLRTCTNGPLVRPCKCAHRVFVITYLHERAFSPPLQMRYTIFSNEAVHWF